MPAHREAAQGNAVVINRKSLFAVRQRLEHVLFARKPPAVVAAPIRIQREVGEGFRAEIAPYPPFAANETQFVQVAAPAVQKNIQPHGFRRGKIVPGRNKTPDTAEPSHPTASDSQERQRPPAASRAFSLRAGLPAGFLPRLNTPSPARRLIWKRKGPAGRLRSTASRKISTSGSICSVTLSAAPFSTRKLRMPCRKWSRPCANSCRSSMVRRNLLLLKLRPCRQACHRFPTQPRWPQ